jgi:hypothetical protein
VSNIFSSPRFASWLLAAIGVLLTGLIGYLILIVPGIRADTSASRRSDDLQSCRAEFRTGIDQAQFALLGSFLDVQEIDAQATVARQDSFTLTEHQRRLDEALATRVLIRQDLANAVRAYDEANRLSREDPDLFLARCRGG